ncbi:hypothetical protein DSECCO2_451980 [anaerobic digester metagenome]
MFSGSATIASSQSFSRIQRRMFDSPCPASPVKSAEPLWTSAIRLPSGVDRFILESMFARKSICPSLDRVTSENSGSPLCSMTKRGSRIPAFPPIRSRSPFQLLPYGGFESMKSNSRDGNASFESVEYSGPPTMLSAASPSPFRRRSAFAMAYVSALISWP